MPYNIASKSAKALAEALGCKRVRHDSPTFTNQANHTIVNWGYGGDVDFIREPNRMLNHTNAVSRAGNKLLALRTMRQAGVCVPEFTTDEWTAQCWYVDNIKVVGRFKLRGHSGDGIVITDDHDYPESEGGMDVIHMRETRGHVAPLYVKYIKKQDEYRYHVFRGQVIDIQQKRKRRDMDNDQVDYQVRSHHTGWVYCRDNVNTRVGLDTMAINAVQCLGLDFGAVDIIWNEKAQRGYVLEVNTACGLEGRTVEIYADAIRRTV